MDFIKGVNVACNRVGNNLIYFRVVVVKASTSKIGFIKSNNKKCEEDRCAISFESVKFILNVFPYSNELLQIIASQTSIM